MSALNARSAGWAQRWAQRWDDGERLPDEDAERAGKYTEKLHPRNPLTGEWIKAGAGLAGHLHGQRAVGRDGGGKDVEGRYQGGGLIKPARGEPVRVSHVRPAYRAGYARVGQAQPSDTPEAFTDTEIRAEIKHLETLNRRQGAHPLRVAAIAKMRKVLAGRAGEKRLPTGPGPLKGGTFTDYTARAEASRVGLTVTHEKVGHTGQGLWKHKGWQLPAYIQHVANDLIESGHPMSRAIQMAIGIVKNWATGRTGQGGTVHPDTQAKAVAAVAEWEKLKAQAKGSRIGKALGKAAKAVSRADGDPGDEWDWDDSDPVDLSGVDVTALEAKALARENGATDTQPARTAGRAVMPGYDEIEFDDSWAGDLSDLPDLTGLGPEEFEAVARDDGEPPLGEMGDGEEGSAQRAYMGFAKLKGALAAKGARNPGALAAWIGRRKYGKAKFSKAASSARKLGHAARTRKLPAPAPANGSSGWGEIYRTYPLDGLDLVRTGDFADGRTVEAYCAVFGTPAEIKDHEGNYLEVIEPTAFNKRLADLSRSRAGSAAVKVLYNHGMTIHGTPAERFSIPVGVCRHVEADSRGLRTVTRYNETALGDEVLESIREGAITAQSFTGRIVRSDPQLVRGDKHRPRNGQLTTVRRLELGLREYGPTPFPAYSGAEVLGVRMSLPGAYDEGDPYDDSYGSADDGTSPDEDAAAGRPHDDGHLDRSYGNRLYRLRTEEMLRASGISLPGR